MVQQHASSFRKLLMVTFVVICALLVVSVQGGHAVIGRWPPKAKRRGSPERARVSPSRWLLRVPNPAPTSSAGLSTGSPRTPRLLPLAASSGLRGYTVRAHPTRSGDRYPSSPRLHLRPPPPREDPISADHFAGVVQHRPLDLLPAAASSDLRRRLFGGRRRRQHAGLPLPIDRATTISDRNAPALATVHDILEDIVHYTLSNLRNIQKSLLYWRSRAKGTYLQQMYFMIFERGPKAFLQTTWQTLAGLRSGSPSEHLLNSAADMVSTKLDALMIMQDCLAAFLAEVYSEVDKCKGRLTENPDQSLHELLVVLNRVFLNLEESLNNFVEAQTASFTLRIFQTLPEVDVESSTATSLIYQNLLRLDIYVSNKLAVHQKPRNKTIYWLPYTCGAIGLSACSLWLLRHSSFMGSSDTDGSIRDAKESVAGYWDQHAVKLLEVLSRIRHPHLVILVGACPDRGCLVYVYMENGSLADRLKRINDTPPIACFSIDVL